MYLLSRILLVTWHCKICSSFSRDVTQRDWTNYSHNKRIKIYVNERAIQQSTLYESAIDRTLEVLYCVYYEVLRQTFVHVTRHKQNTYLSGGVNVGDFATCQLNHVSKRLALLNNVTRVERLTWWTKHSTIVIYVSSGELRNTYRHHKTKRLTMYSYCRSRGTS